MVKGLKIPIAHSVKLIDEGKELLKELRDAEDLPAGTSVTKKSAHRVKEIKKIPKVLVLDDDKVVNKIICSALDSVDNLQYESHNDPFQALNTVINEHYILMIVDIQLPGMNGMQFIHRCKEACHRKITTVAVTGHANKSVVQKLKTLNVDGIWVKPIDVKKVLQTAKSSLKEFSKTNG